MGFVILGGLIIVLLQNKEQKRLGLPLDITGPDAPDDVPMGEEVFGEDFRTDLLRQFRGWAEMKVQKQNEFEQNMRPTMMILSASPEISIHDFRQRAPQFEKMFPAYIRSFSDLLQMGENIMSQCNQIQNRSDPAYMTHEQIQAQLAPLADIYRNITRLWEQLNRRTVTEGQEKRLAAYTPKDQDLFKPMDTKKMDEDDSEAFFKLDKAPLEAWLDRVDETPGVNVEPWFSAVPVQADHADDVRNFGTPKDPRTAIDAMGPRTFNTTNTPLATVGKPPLTMDATDKAPAKPRAPIEVRPGRPEGPLQGFVQGDLPTHRIRVDETLPEEGPMTEAMLRNMSPEEKEQAQRRFAKQMARAKGALGMIDYNGNTYSLKQIEDFVNNLDRGSRVIPTSVDAALQDYDSLSDAIVTLDGLITQDELAGGRFSKEEARAVKLIANQARSRYEKMIHSQFNVSVKKRNEKDFPVEWMAGSKKARTGARDVTPGGN